MNPFTATRSELQARVAELEAENARLRQERDSANAWLDAILEEMGKDNESK